MSSGITLFVLGFFALIFLSIVGYAVMAYNSLVRLNRDCEKAWSNIDVLLKQRSDELPKLIDTAKEYMEYEEEVLQEVTKARTRVEESESPKEQAEANKQVESALDNLMAVAEDYPELKANENFNKLQERISEIEDKIADRREYYNEAVNTFNIRIHQIPYSFIANLLGYADKELFEVDEEDREDVDISSGFDS
jgi:LemA protein